MRGGYAGVPEGELSAVRPETPAVDAMEIMAREDVNQVAVISDHHLEGMISRANILHVLQSQAELKAS